MSGATDILQRILARKAEEIAERRQRLSRVYLRASRAYRRGFPGGALLRA